MIVPRYPWDTDPAPSAPPEPDFLAGKPKPRGRRPASATRTARAAPGASPDWRYHHLTISGPAERVANAARAARGSGIIPWQIDGADVEETVFALAVPSLACSVAQPASRRHLTIEGCRILARQFRERVEARQARAAALIGQSQACPFDLHALLPVPDAVLSLGPTDPAALAWLAAQWGVTDRLRQVTIREKATTGRRLPRGHAVIGYGFFTAGETPRAAIDHCEKRWPALRFSLVPRPTD